MRLITRLYSAATCAFVLAGLTGCGHELLKPPPRASVPVTVVYTGKGLSGMSDLPTGTYQVPDSQIIVSGHQKAGKSPASMMFGVLGVLVANEVDKSGGKSAVKNSTAALTERIDTRTQSILADLLSSDEFRTAFTANAASDSPVLEFGGNIVLTFIDDTNVQPAVILHASWKQASRGPKSAPPAVIWSTRYMCSIGGPKPLDGPQGWTDNGAAALKATVSAELTQAIRYMLLDVKQPVARDDTHKVLVTGHFPLIADRLQVVSYDLGESGDLAVFAPKLSDATVLSGVLMLDKSQLSIREATKDDRTKKLN